MDRFEALVRPEDHPGEQRTHLVRLMRRLAGLPPPPDPDGDFPRYAEYRDTFLRCAQGADPEALEEAFLTLYAHLHMHEAPYTPDERRILDEAGGYWAHAGGLSPILRAGAHLHAQTVSMDLGAGNGLQGLLLQVLHPHAKTVQIEISSRMVKIGERLRTWLGVPRERVEWIVGDVCDLPLPEADFIYLYRPVRPSTEKGHAFYVRLAATLEQSAQPVVIFSIADCLRDYLSSRFEVFFGDGHLTCFRTS